MFWGRYYKLKCMVRFDAEVFREAVELGMGLSNPWSCTWLLAATSGFGNEEDGAYLKLYRTYFKPEKPYSESCWWPYLDRESRYLALLLMAEMVEHDDIEIGGFNGEL